MAIKKNACTVLKNVPASLASEKKILAQTDSSTTLTTLKSQMVHPL